MSNLLDGAVEVKPRVRTITLKRLMNIIAAVSGAKMCTIITETDPRMRKTDNPYFGQVVKRSRMNVTIGFIYANSVNRQRTREGSEADFKPEERKWGTKIDKTCMVMHKDKLYLEFKPNGQPASVEYFYNGEPISKETLQPWLPEPRSAADHQGVEKEVVYRNVLMENITDFIFMNVHNKVRR